MTLDQLANLQSTAEELNSRIPRRNPVSGRQGAGFEPALESSALRHSAAERTDIKKVKIIKPGINSEHSTI